MSAPLLAKSEHPVLIDTGPEAIAGSTRLKAGTAQKVALNLISTATMIQLGRVYRGLMVDMRPTNAKLRLRSEKMVARIVGCELNVAAGALAAAEGDIKTASLIASGITPEVAAKILAECGGNLREALERSKRSQLDN